MTDLKERLRTFGAWADVQPRHSLVQDAADHIETLEAELAAMKARGDRLAEALAAEPTEAMAWQKGYTACHIGPNWDGKSVACDAVRAWEFYSRRAIAANQHHGGNDADT